MIIASAIRLADGLDYVGKRHGDCFYFQRICGKERKIIFDFYIIFLILYL